MSVRCRSPDLPATPRSPSHSARLRARREHRRRLCRRGGTARGRRRARLTDHCRAGAQGAPPARGPWLRRLVRVGSAGLAASLPRAWRQRHRLPCRSGISGPTGLAPIVAPSGPAPCSRRAHRTGSVFTRAPSASPAEVVAEAAVVAEAEFRRRSRAVVRHVPRPPGAAAPNHAAVGRSAGPWWERRTRRRPTRPGSAAPPRQTLRPRLPDRRGDPDRHLDPGRRHAPRGHHAPARHHAPDRPRAIPGPRSTRHHQRPPTPQAPAHPQALPLARSTPHRQRPPTPPVGNPQAPAPFRTAPLARPIHHRRTPENPPAPDRRPTSRRSVARPHSPALAVPPAPAGTGSWPGSGGGTA